MNNFVFHFFLSYTFYKIVLEFHNIELLNKKISRNYPKGLNVINVFIINETNIVSSIILFCMLLDDNRFLLSLEYNNVYDFFNVFMRIIIVYFLTEVYFYMIHRFVFHGNLPQILPFSNDLNNYFKRLHDIHHEFVLPIPRSAFYAHPIENIICNTGTLMLPLMICPLPYYFTLIWAAIAVFNGIRSHSGNFYDIKYIDEIQNIHFNRITHNFHDYHHKYRNVEYGTGFFMDRLFGTSIL
jgi:sterol desaturase/sphingolipid hydroxylase (fatty acid hydroxylase superfamily)